MKKSIKALLTVLASIYGISVVNISASAVVFTQENLSAPIGEKQLCIFALAFFCLVIFLLVFCIIEECKEVKTYEQKIYEAEYMLKILKELTEFSAKQIHDEIMDFHDFTEQLCKKYTKKLKNPYNHIGYKSSRKSRYYLEQQNANIVTIYRDVQYKRCMIRRPMAKSLHNNSRTALYCRTFS